MRRGLIIYINAAKIVMDPIGSFSVCCAGTFHNKSSNGLLKKPLPALPTPPACPAGPSQPAPPVCPRWSLLCPKRVAHPCLPPFPRTCSALTGLIFSDFFVNEKGLCDQPDKPKSHKRRTFPSWTRVRPRASWTSPRDRDSSPGPAASSPWSVGGLSDDTHFNIWGQRVQNTVACCWEANPMGLAFLHLLEDICTAHGHGRYTLCPFSGPRAALNEWALVNRVPRCDIAHCLCICSLGPSVTLRLGG